jgi:hypothetical protein
MELVTPDFGLVLWTVFSFVLFGIIVFGLYKLYKAYLAKT